MKNHIIPFILITGLVLISAITTARLNAHTILTKAASPSEISTVGGAYLTFAGKFGGELSKEDLQKHKEINVRGCANGSRIFQFTLNITRDGKTKVYTGKSHQLSAEMLTQIKSLSSGDMFHFEDIKAHLPSGGEVDVHARKFVVV